MCWPAGGLCVLRNSAGRGLSVKQDMTMGTAGPEVLEWQCKLCAVRQGTGSPQCAPEAPPSWRPAGCSGTAAAARYQHATSAVRYCGKYCM